MGGRGRERRRDILAVIRNFRTLFKGSSWTCPLLHGHCSAHGWPLFGLWFFFFMRHAQDDRILLIGYALQGGVRTTGLCLMTPATRATLTQCLGYGVISYTLDKILRTLWQETKSLWHIERPVLHLSFVCTIFLRLWETSFFKFCHGWEMKHYEWSFHF